MNVHLLFDFDSKYFLYLSVHYFVKRFYFSLLKISIYNFFTMQEVQQKIKIIKKVKNPATVCFPLKGSSGGVERNKNRNKTVIYLSTSTASPHSLTGSSVSGTSPGPPTGANSGTHRPGPVAVTRVCGEGPRLVQNTASTNCEG